jgi:hypothetical protein
MLENNEKVRLYKPEDVRNPYFVVPFLFLLIIIGINGLLYYIQKPSEYLFFILFLPLGIIVCSYLIYIHFAHCAYAEIYDKRIICRNHFKRKLGEMFFEEIIEIIAYKKWWYDVRIKDIHNKSIILNTVIKPTDEFFNELIKKAVNCKKIDLRNIRKAAPDLILYQKNDN